MVKDNLKKTSLGIVEGVWFYSHRENCIRCSEALRFQKCCGSGLIPQKRKTSKLRIKPPIFGHNMTQSGKIKEGNPL